MSREQLVQVAWEIHLALIPPNDLLASGERNAVAIIERLLGQEREKAINAICVLCRSGEKPYLQWFGGKNWDGRYQAWVHNVKLGGCTETQTCPATTIRQLDLTQDIAPSSAEEGKG